MVPLEWDGYLHLEQDGYPYLEQDEYLHLEQDEYQLHLEQDEYLHLEQDEYLHQEQDINLEQDRYPKNRMDIYTQSRMDIFTQEQDEHLKLFLLRFEMLGIEFKACTVPHLYTFLYKFTPIPSPPQPPFSSLPTNHLPPITFFPIQYPHYLSNFLSFIFKVLTMDIEMKRSRLTISTHEFRSLQIYKRYC